MDLERKVDELIKNIILLQGKTEQRQKSFDMAASQANQALSEAGKKLNESATDIRQVTRHTVEQAINQPVDKLNERIKIINQELSFAADYVGDQQKDVVRKLKFIMWGTLAASGVSIIISLTAAFLITQNTVKQLEHAEWTNDINSAVRKGRLTRCNGNAGLCVKVKGKLIRLDE